MLRLFWSMRGLAIFMLARPWESGDGWEMLYGDWVSEYGEFWAYW